MTSSANPTPHSRNPKPLRLRYHDVVGDRRCTVVDTWWQTETGGIMLTPLPGDKDAKPGAAMRPFYGVRVAYPEYPLRHLVSFVGPCGFCASKVNDRRVRHRHQRPIPLRRSAQEGMVRASGSGRKRARQVEPLLIDSNGAVVDGPDASGLLVLRGAVPGMARTIANDFSRFDSVVQLACDSAIYASPLISHRCLSVHRDLRTHTHTRARAYTRTH